MTIKDFEEYAISKGFPYVKEIGEYKGETIYAGLFSLSKHAKLGYPLLMKSLNGNVIEIDRQEMKKILSEM